MAGWLETHRIVVPRVWVQGWLVSRAIHRKAAGPIFLKESNHRGTAWTAVQPQGQWSCGGIVASFEKPEPHRHIGSDRQVARVCGNARRRLTDAAILDE